LTPARRKWSVLLTTWNTTPDSTAKEIDAACDTGCIAKVISDMRLHGYGIRKGWRNVPCDHGNRTRQVRTYRLTHRPRTQPDLFKTA
jgi:hypothetical protein